MENLGWKIKDKTRDDQGQEIKYENLRAKDWGWIMNQPAAVEWGVNVGGAVGGGTTTPSLCSCARAKA